MAGQRDASGLTDRQRRFAQEFMLDLNATQAAIRSGYSARTAGEQAARLLANVRIQSFIAQLRAEQAQRLNIEADVVLRELLYLARSDIADLFDDAGQLRPLSEMPEHARRAVASIEVEELLGGSGPDRGQIGWVKKVRLWNKPQALELLGKHLKLWIERHEHTGTDGAPLPAATAILALTDADLERIAAGRSS
ncbi:MAG: terminase small subunit [bacterium]|jgi:phage terminase small subunit